MDQVDGARHATVGLLEATAVNRRVRPGTTIAAQEEEVGTMAAVAGTATWAHRQAAAEGDTKTAARSPVTGGARAAMTTAAMAQRSVAGQMTTTEQQQNPSLFLLQH